MVATPPPRSRSVPALILLHLTDFNGPSESAQAQGRYPLLPFMRNDEVDIYLMPNVAFIHTVLQERSWKEPGKFEVYQPIVFDLLDATDSTPTYQIRQVLRQLDCLDIARTAGKAASLKLTLDALSSPVLVLRSFVPPL